MASSTGWEYGFGRQATGNAEVKFSDTILAKKGDFQSFVYSTVWWDRR